MALTQEIDGVLYNIDPRSGKRLTARNNQNKYWDFDDEIIRANKAIGNANSLIGKYDSLKKLTAPSSNKGKQTMGIFDRQTQQGRGDLYQGSRIGFGGPDDSLDRFYNQRQNYRDNTRDPSRRNRLSDFSNIAKFKLPEETSLLDPRLDVMGQMYKNANFGLGSLDGEDPPPGKDKTDWLGWAGIGTGLLQGAGGIMDYFANMRGLELTEEAMNRKYAADDRNYLAQATALNNVIDTRKDYIDKTQGGRNTDFLKNIPV